MALVFAEVSTKALVAARNLPQFAVTPADFPSLAVVGNSGIAIGGYASKSLGFFGSEGGHGWLSRLASPAYPSAVAVPVSINDYGTVVGY